MVAIGWTAWCAVTNSNPWTGSYGSPVQTRPRLLIGSRVLRGAGEPHGGADAVRRVPPSSARRVRSPASRAACFTQFRIACAEGSNWRASSSGVRPLRTSSTIRCRNSGAYGRWLFGIWDLPFRPNDGVSTKPGQLHGQVRPRGTSPGSDGSAPRYDRPWRGSRSATPSKGSTMVAKPIPEGLGRVRRGDRVMGP
jgi:hypothetical protein